MDGKCGLPLAMLREEKIAIMQREEVGIWTVHSHIKSRVETNNTLRVLNYLCFSVFLGLNLIFIAPQMDLWRLSQFVSTPHLLQGPTTSS